MVPDRYMISDTPNRTSKVSLLTETVAAKTKVVGIDTRAIVSKVKRGFAWVRRSRIAIRDKHLRKGETVKQAPAIVMDVVQRQTFAIIEANPEGPLLPRDFLAIDTERRTFGLNYLIWLRRGSRAWSEGRMILAGGHRVDSTPVKFALFIIDALVRSHG